MQVNVCLHVAVVRLIVDGRNLRLCGLVRRSCRLPITSVCVKMNTCIGYCVFYHIELEPYF
jgi:hypothetical protein